MCVVCCGVRIPASGAVYICRVRAYLWRLDNGVRSLGLQAVVNFPVWVLGTKPGSFGGEHEALKEKDYFCF